MFDSLRKKFASWLGKDTDKPKKIAEKSVKKEKKITTKKSKNEAEKIPQQISKDIEAAVPLETPPEESILEKKPSFFSRLINKISTSTLTKEDFDKLFSEFEIALSENNVALKVVDKIKESLEKDLVGIEIKRGEAEKIIMRSLKESILSVLINPPNLIDAIKEKSKTPFIILFFGINGSGKTTSLAKIAHLLKKNKISCVMAAADTFRAASIEQIQKHGLSLGIEVISSQYGSDPAAVAFDAIQHAKKHNIRAVLIDTAGRMYTKANLLKEMEKIVRVSHPDLKIFVGESITGNDAVEQAKTFNEAIGIDGIILSKADIDEKAGAVLSVSYITKAPIYFLGTGQEYDDLKPFSKDEVIKHLGLKD